MTNTTLLISSKNYSSWSLRGYLLVRMANLPFVEKVVDPDDPVNRRELLMQSSSFRIPALMYDGIMIWDTIAIAEHLNELLPDAHMLPEDRAARARCRSISGEMHSGFATLREACPMNLRLFRPRFAVWSAVQADIDRITEIWTECLMSWNGPWLFGDRPSVADAMYAPVVTRFHTYDIKLDKLCERYCRHIMAWPAMKEWFAAAQREPEQIDELDIEF